jgi:hypothetical protein
MQALIKYSIKIISKYPKGINFNELCEQLRSMKIIDFEN